MYADRVHSRLYSDREDFNRLNEGEKSILFTMESRGSITPDSAVILCRQIWNRTYKDQKVHSTVSVIYKRLIWPICRCLKYPKFNCKPNGPRATYYTTQAPILLA